MESDPKRVYHRCAGCSREIKSLQVVWIKGKPYGSICAQIQQGLIKPRSRRHQIDHPKFIFDDNTSH